MDIFELIRSAPDMIAVIVLVYFGTKLQAQMSQAERDRQQIIMRLIDLCADEEAPRKPTTPQNGDHTQKNT